MSDLIVSPRAAAIVVACAAALQPPSGHAAEVLQPLPWLEPVIVTAAAPTSPLTVVTDPRLPRQPVPASDGADYLKTIPGFAAVRNGGSNADPVLRGMFGSRLTLLSNDGAMPGACPARMDNPLSYVAPETYDRLEVVKGPQTVLWGPMGSAGTVRFVRETPHDDVPGWRLHGSALAGSWGRNDQVADATFGAEHGFARVSASRAEADDYRDGDGARVPSAWKKWSTDAAVGWSGARGSLTFDAGSGDGQARYAGRAMDGSRFRRDSLGLRATLASANEPSERIELALYRNVADHVMDNYSLREPNPLGGMSQPMAANVDRRTQGGRVAEHWRGTAWQLVAGLDAQDSVHSRRSAVGRDAYRDLPLRTDARFAAAGAFAEASWDLATDWRVVGGARLDHAAATDRRDTVGSMGMMQPNPTAGRTRTELLPGGFLRVEQGAAAGLSWYAGLGHTERMPDYWELFSADRGPAGSVNAFAGVAPETTTQLDLGLRLRRRAFDLWLSAYAGRVDDFLLFTYRTGGAMGSSVAVDNVAARTHGAEAGLEWRPAPRWSLGGTLAYAWGANVSSGQPLPQMPPLDLRVSAEYAGTSWRLGLLGRAVARQTRVAPGQGNVVGRDLGPSAGFATLAFNAAWRLDGRWQLSAGIDNLFDRRYSEHLNLAGSADFGYPADPVRIAEPGRTAWVKLAFDY